MPTVEQVWEMFFTLDSSVRNKLIVYQANNRDQVEIAFNSLARNPTTTAEDVKQVVEGLFRDSPPHKRARVQRKVFACIEAADPSRHFYVQSTQSNQLQQLEDLRWSVLCSGRQTGKSTLCAAFETELQKQGVEVASIMLGDGLPVDNSCRVWVLIDEASQLASLEDHVLDDFLTTIRSLRNRTSQYSLEGMPMFGVYSIVRLLHGHNRRRAVPPSSAVTAAVATAGGGPLGGSNFAGHIPTKNASLLKVADLADAGYFSQQDIQSLLEQYVTQQKQIDPGGNCLQQQDLLDIARSLHELTSGHKGLVGTCCHLLEQHRLTTAEQWQKFSAVSLSRRVGGHGSFARILNVLRFVYPAEGSAASNTLAEQDRRQAQQAALSDVVFNGSHVVQQEKLPLLQELLEEGILVPKPTIDGVSAPFLVLDNVTLMLPCPLMATCILQRLFIGRCGRWDHAVGGLNLLGDLLVQVVHNMNPQVLSMRQTTNADGSSSEYALQAETYMLAVGCMQQQTGRYMVLPEARQHDIKKSSRFRVDFVITSKQTSEPLEAFGMELLSAGTPAQIDEHVNRAQMYSQLHAVKIGGDTKACQMLVVNFFTNVAQQQQPEGLYWPASLQSKDGPVRMAHVVMMQSATHASIHFSAGHGHEAFQLESVPISSSTESGRERVYRHSYD